MNQKIIQIRGREFGDNFRGVNISFNYSNALKTLVSEVVYNSRPLDKTTEYFFKKIPGIDSSDKESLNRVFTFVIRYWILIKEVHNKLNSRKDLDFNEIVHIQHILERHFHGKLDCKGNYEKQVIENFKSLAETQYIKESYPQWLYHVCSKELGNHWEDISIALNQKPTAVLRINKLKTTLEELQTSFKTSGKNVSPIDYYPDALILNKYFDIFKSDEFKSGMFEMQDAGSQAIAPFLEVEAGMRVIDACAGNGGKTLHLSSLMKNKGKILALDIAPHKLEVLKKRMKRAGSFNIETRTIDSSKVIKRLHNSADRLLLDVPCSGTGVLKRNPDIKYHLSEEKLKNLCNTQEEILDKYSSMLCRNGIMVYSTCSILPSENQQQIQRFLAKKTNFELIDQKSISPLDGYDGFYMAKLRRCN